MVNLHLLVVVRAQGWGGGAASDRMIRMLRAAAPHQWLVVGEPADAGSSGSARSATASASRQARFIAS